MTYNPEYNPTGVEGGIDANALPWIAVDAVPGLSFKPLRASAESGLFSVIVKIDGGKNLPPATYFSGLDLLLLSGELSYARDGVVSTLRPGAWGYFAANTHGSAFEAGEDSELLCTFYGPVAFKDEQGVVTSLLTSGDVLTQSKALKIATVPNTLADCVREEVERFEGEGVPLAIAKKDASALVVASADQVDDNSVIHHPYFVDSRSVPWMVPESMPDLGLKVLRVSEETGVASMIVRHNGVAPPHTHIGAGDFMILHGRIGYRAGPPTGYGAGVWMFEPAGARHEATQRVTNDDLIYTANIYGPVAFDSGRGTPILGLMSWIEYKALADAAGVTLVPSSHPGDTTLLASPPLRAA